MVDLEAIENTLDRIRNSSYTTGVMHITAPLWLEHLRWCVKTISDLVTEVKESRKK